jgi:predicted dehydrogenase
MSTHIHRRQFLGRTAALGGCWIGAAATAGLAEEKSANAKLQHACIGAGGMQGMYDLGELAKSPNIEIVAICDVDTRQSEGAAAQFPDARRYQDYREMLDREADRIDSVNVTTPDHMHAPISMLAMKNGKHVYCQKPLTHTVWEARQMAHLAARTGLTTCMGNQIHSQQEYRTATAVVHEGLIGKVREVHSWCPAPGDFWKQGVNARKPPHADPVPAELDWELWLGAAPARPFTKGVYHPIVWRGWQDFGGGAIADMACHIFDPVFTSLKLTAPKSVTAQRAEMNSDTWPAWEIVSYVFPGTRYTAGDTVNVTWYDGGKQPAAEITQLPKSVKVPASASLFIGTEGRMLLPHVDMPQLFPTDRFADREMPLQEGVSHYTSWVATARQGKQVSDNFAYAGPLTEAVLLGTIAIRFPGQQLQWDTAQLKFTNNAEANGYLTKEYTSGFEA